MENQYPTQTNANPVAPADQSQAAAGSGAPQQINAEAPANGMHNPALAGKKPAGVTQDFLDIQSVRDDVVVLKDQSLRAVILVSSINFSLKSNEEQEAIIYAYQDFLNSLDFPIQIVIQSRKLDINVYLNKLKDLEKEQSNELLRLQIAEYSEYIKELVEISQIMSKTFYVVVSLRSGEEEDGAEGAGNGQPSGKQKKKDDGLNPAMKVVRERRQMAVMRNQLQYRVDHVMSAVGGVGVQASQLNTQELIELYYNTYNPITVQQESLADMNKIAVDQEG